MTSERGRPRVLLLQHAVYPYRRPLFEQMSRTVDLTVAFCIAAKSFRRWNTSTIFEGSGFRPLLLGNIRIGPFVVSRRFADHIRHGRYDVLVIGVIDLITLPQVAVLLWMARRRQIPIVVCEEFFPTEWYMQSRPWLARMAVWTRRFVYRHTASFATWNSKARDFLLESGVPPQRVFTGPHAYPAPERSAAAPEPARPKRIVSISYLLPRKGIDLLIRAFADLDTDAELHIGGSGPAEDELRALAKGDARVHFHGFIDNDEKDRLLAVAWLFVLPTLWDPWGLVVNEALYRRVPVVVTDAAGVAPELDGAGAVVPAGDVGSLTSVLRRLISDESARDNLASAATDVVGRWTVEAQSRPFLDAVDLALRSPSR